MEPLLFKPLIKRARWGGRKLGSVLGKPLGAENDYAESWEIADQASGQSIVDSGGFDGRSLSELISENAKELLGRHSDHSQFPLLIKFLDANDWLSLQVHPNDEQAKNYDETENGKTEAWVIIDAEPDSKIISGLKTGITKDEFEHHLRNGSIEETLNTIPAVPGDCVYVPAGTVHALGPGILLAEVQQQSNLTFRLHDWGRLGSDGKPREIHVEQSLAVTDFDRGPVGPVESRTVAESDGNRHEELVSGDYFQIARRTLANPCDLVCDNQFRILMVLSGSVTLETNCGSVNAAKGTTILIPAAVTDASIVPDETATLLEVTRD